MPSTRSVAPARTARHCGVTVHQRNNVRLQSSCTTCVLTCTATVQLQRLRRFDQSGFAGITSSRPSNLQAPSFAQLRRCPGCCKAARAWGIVVGWESVSELPGLSSLCGCRSQLHFIKRRDHKPASEQRPGARGCRPGERRRDRRTASSSAHAAEEFLRHVINSSMNGTSLARMSHDHRAALTGETLFHEA